MRALHFGLYSVVFGAAMFACGGGEATTPPANTPTAPTTAAPATSVPSATPTTATVAPPVATAATEPPPRVAIRASTMAKDLEGYGLDVKKLPTLAKMDPVKRNKVMNTFTKSLGVKCSACHLENFKADTANKRVARNMWDQWVVGMTMEDGGFLYCDSCHQGHQEFLDRKDKKQLSTWMSDNLVDKVKRIDKKEHGCPTCHGESFEPDFLDVWKKGKSK